jgi:hypothetical protein
LSIFNPDVWLAINSSSVRLVSYRGALIHYNLLTSEVFFSFRN